MKASVNEENNPIHLPVVETGDVITVNGEDPALRHGLTAFTAALFIVGEMAGSGVLALPNAVANTGWIGIIVMIILGVLSATCGIVLSSSWLILRSNFREYHEHVRNPYPTLGFHTYGKLGKQVVQICICATLIGACTVFLLLASENFNSLIDLGMSSISKKNEYRIWLLICGAVLLPLTWLGTPKHFWPVALFAILATSAACLIIVVTIGNDFDGSAQNRVVTSSTFFSAFGAIAFSFGGTAAFPTIQCDMKKPSFFSSSIVMGYFAVLAMYLPVSIVGFLSFQDDVKTNILMNLPSNSLGTKCVTTLVSIHLLFSFVIVLNPISQQLEEWFKLPVGRITIKTCLVRTFLVSIILALAQGIPHFGLFLNLVGSSTTTLLTFVFPCVFFLKLQNNISLHFKVILYEIIILGVLAAVTSTYFAIKAIIDKLK